MSAMTEPVAVFGLVIPDVYNPAYAQVIDGAHRAAAAAGCRLLTGSTAGDRHESEQQLAAMAAAGFRGVLLAGSETAEDLASLESCPIPWVLVNRRNPYGHRYVVLDDEAGAAVAVKHLAKLGHERIAHLAGPSTSETAQRRCAGYMAAMTEAGLTVDDDLVAESDYTDRGGAAAMETLLAKSGATAVFAANIASAVGALAAARARGVSVPGDLSVVAMHDLPLADYLSPPLTTVRMPLSDLGRRGVELLDSTHPGRPIKETISSPIQLVQRSSTAPPPASKKKRLGRR